jgi:nucleoside phosphorylase
MQESTARPIGRNPRRVVILTALPVEYTAVRAHLTEVVEETGPRGVVYERGTFECDTGPWQVAMCQVGAGNVPAALHASWAIERYEPAVVVFVGVAGGLKDVAIGDVVAATKVYGYESGKAKATFEPRSNVGRSSFRIVQRARAEARKEDWWQRIGGDAPERGPRAFVAPIAAGEKVVASTRSATFHFLRKQYGDALAVEMEGRGFLEGAWPTPQVQAMVVRGISDLVKRKQEAEAEGSQELASRHASAFAFQVLARLELEESPSVYTPIPESPSTKQASSEALLDYLSEGRSRFHALVEDRKLAICEHGSWEAALLIAGELARFSANESFLNLIAATNPRYTGWPPWIDSRGFRIPDSSPHVFEGAWEALIVAKDADFFRHIDFWRASPEGKFYQYRALQDDLPREPQRRSPLSVLDFAMPLYRAAEALAVGLSFGKAMAVQPESTALSFCFRWTGLEGRELASWSEPQRYVSPGRVAYQDVVVSFGVVPLDTPKSSLFPKVHEAMRPLYETFNGFELSEKVTQELTDRVLQREW